jgi:RHS repeat-associated protein
VHRPADQSSYRTPASFTLSATASDSDGSISKVEFYQGSSLLRTLTQPPYSVAISQSAPGVYSYSAKATDNNGLAAQSGSISVTVLVDVAPTIALTAPADGSTYRTPASITLSASASDPDGSIARVDFYQGNSLVGTATQAPYSITIDQSTPGVYAFLAKAVDDGGITTQSNSISVTVSALPTMYYIHADQIDTPRMVTDQSNKVVWRWDAADPFGASPPDEDPDGDGTKFTLNLRFPGQYYDKETELHYNYFRDYDPQTGRYIQSDPVGLQGGTNTYGYVSQNPVSYADPTGQWVWMVIPGLCAAGGCEARWDGG